VAVLLVFIIIRLSWLVHAIYGRALCSALQPPMSFISVEPQSRILLESHSNNLLARFDTQIRIIVDRYLAFFQERSIIIITLRLTF
jgi:hypothetical protein